ncbi:hypothetical protein K437DRAFT_103248 [Tilletiaria anomala UBC 951]|uniref:VWFA domain-containing protein n=1 Tax=Tilletiaria anomala (strain ATCC 24038 / CBS 436.72 / UBC 951) TaxID=1037660 RepID=A0A066VZU1_TILAU|nr:uncharacterized protein K437DRAFT_103248 [Tilletiaria anomala UBC 951]KDN47001.1 hypothetical protein K437DRAFT_103248 [Tilletiaria anomala UBC 951]
MAGPSHGGGVYGMFGAVAAQTLASDPLTSYSSQPISAADFDMNTGAADFAPGRALDLLFIMDATGSMGSYIREATKNIETICDNIVQSEQLPGPGALRVGLIAFRDHPPQDHTYITKNFGFSSNIQEMKDNLKQLYASGGGDGPEAVTAAMKQAVQLPWRTHATKLAVLIADAPPHGIGEIGDGFPNGSPDNEDPLVLARRMAALGISLFMVACEPALSGYQHAADFYQGLVRVTGGMCVPLTTASLLSHVIVAAAGEAMDMERLHRDVGDAVLERLRGLSLDQQQQQQQQSTQAFAAASVTLDDVARELHEKLLLRNENTKQLYIESIYRESEESRHNIEIWAAAPNLETARPHIKRVVGSRLSEKYLQTRRAAAELRSSTAPFPHPRQPVPIPSSLYATSSGSSAASSSPSRKVLSDFSSFSATPGMSVSASTSPTLPQGSDAFLSPRSSMQRASADDDDDEDPQDHKPSRPLPIAVGSDGGLEVAGEDGQRLAYRQGTISLDQARRLAMQSAYRGGLG